MGNSFSVDEENGVYIVTDAALYRFEAGGSGIRTVWREGYANTGQKKPGQTQKGSGTTPTLFGPGLVAITDNADPIRVVVMRRGRSTGGRARTVCATPVFNRGESSDDQSLIAVDHSLIAENNFGYTGPLSVQQGATTKPGLERVDVRRNLSGCVPIWRSTEIAPSVVPKVSLDAGLVYTYTKPAGDRRDPWYLTALDFRSGRTVWKQAGRLRPRVQQQLRAGHDQPRQRHRLRGHARRPGRAARRHAATAPEHRAPERGRALRQPAGAGPAGGNRRAARAADPHRGAAAQLDRPHLPVPRPLEAPPHAPPGAGADGGPTARRAAWRGAPRPCAASALARR